MEMIGLQKACGNFDPVGSERVYFVCQQFLKVQT
jgi:hypothetical protein